MTDVTRILSAIGQADPQAATQLLPLIYDKLRRLAGEGAAEALGISPTTAERHWVCARAWLQIQIRGS